MPKTDVELAQKAVEASELEINLDQPLIMANGKPMESLKRDIFGDVLKNSKGEPTGELEPMDLREQLFGILLRPRQNDNWTNKQILTVHRLAKKIMEATGPIRLTVAERNFILRRIETEDARMVLPAHKAVYISILDPSLGDQSELPPDNQKDKKRD